MGEQIGLVFDIQGFSLHDGPGCRTVVFLKGCPLSCSWCANPEGIAPYRQVLYRAGYCIKCNDCRDGCKSQLISTNFQETLPIIEDSKCRHCIGFECVDACNTEALKICGYYISVKELMRKIQRDRKYWGARGGITLSGGEPMLQYGYIKAVLQQCYDSYIHTCLETSGHAPWDHFEKVLPYLEWILFDLKHMDPQKHKLKTGISNQLILENARKLASQKKVKLFFRMPVIPEFNDSILNIERTAVFLKSIGKKEINILPFHHLGSSKYEQLRLSYKDSSLKTPSSESMRDISAVFAKHSITTYIGSDTPF